MGGLLSDLRYRLRALFRRDDLERELDDELRFHLEHEAAKLRAAGLAPDEALRRARIALGGIERIKDDDRDVRGISWLEVAAADLRYTLRGMRRAPGTAALIVLTLAFGIGATTAIFSVVDAVLFRALPYAHADRLMTVWEPTSGSPYGRMGYATVTDLAQGVPGFESVAAADVATATLIGAGTPEPLVGQRVTWPWFRTLGTLPALGRDFLPAEDAPGAARVVVLSQGLWRQRFGGDSTLVGRTIRLDAIPMTVVGIMPAGFTDVLQPDAQFWVPLRYNAASPGACRDCHHLQVIARLTAGTTREQARQQVAALHDRIKAEYPDQLHATSFPVVPLRDYVVRDVKGVMLTVLGAVLFVLLIACVNVANLLLAQGAQRRAEFAVRAALGAGRRRLVRQVLTESLVLAGLGGVAGVGLALLGVPALLSLGPPGLALTQGVAVDARVLLFALSVTTVVGLLAGLVPALHLGHDDLAHDMQGAGRRTVAGARTTRAALVVVEVSLALVLLVGSGLLLQSLRRLFLVSPGFEPANLLSMQIQTAGPRFRSDTAYAAYFDRVLAAVRALPGVESAALTSQLPLSGELDQYGVHSEPAPGLEIEHPGYRYAVSDGYLETMRIAVRRGRALSAGDRAGAAPVAVIGETMASHGWGGGDPIGRRVRIGPADRGPWYTIVGVVADVLQQSLTERANNAIYVPESQWFAPDGAMSLVTRVRGESAALAPAIRAAIWSVDPDQAVLRIATMDELVARTEGRRRFAMVLFAVFAVVALTLAAAGIFGVLAGSVAERRQEIGVRSALGASRARVVTMILRQGMVMAALGVVIGLVAAGALSRVIGGLLYGTSRLDPAIYAGVAALLLGVALLACWAPAARAARVDPMESLRAE